GRRGPHRVPLRGHALRRGRQGGLPEGQRGVRPQAARAARGAAPVLARGGEDLRAWLLAWALAYVMPSYSVLRRTAEARDKLELVSLKVEGSAQVPKASAEALASTLGVQAGQGELQLSMAVSMRMPGRCRVELSSSESTRAVAAVSSNGKRRVEGA